MNALTEKFREVSLAILPIAGVVLLLHFFLVPLENDVLMRFLIGSLLIMIGMPVFLLGVDISIEPMGEGMSQALIETGKMKIVVTGSFLFGFIISVAEPDLHILAQQVSGVTNNVIPTMLLVIVVSLGIGFMIGMGMYRILKSIALNKFLTIIYGAILLLALFSNSDFLAIAFDASGSTTGSITVPFMLAMAAGASAITRSRLDEDTDSFGLLGIASSGAILGVLIMGLVSGNNELTGQLPVDETASAGVWGSFLSQVPVTARKVLLALVPVIILFLIVNALRFYKLINAKKFV